ncbi:response regulator transcription factor [Bdellovibrio sp. HCB337]|uniref:response regulator transcription factor n=1 Tax=Bdellovibrio sp. HCB337 TaxID=3394358 RepID=UPI0039A4E9FF
MVGNTHDSNATILVVEDEQEIRELMALHLLRQGFKVKECSSAEEAQSEFQKQKFNLVILDWMLPGISGFDFLNLIKKSATPTNVLMVTAKTEPQDIVSGLESGADDYLTKPFDPSVFMARVRALLRRSKAHEAPQATEAEKVRLGGLSVNFKTYEVKLIDEPLHLTPSEFKLLANLIESHGRVLTRDQLIENIQGEGINVTGRTIDTHVFGLRKKLGAWSDNIETIRGVGYRVKMDPQ